MTDLERLGRNVGEQRKLEPPSELQVYLALILAEKRIFQAQTQQARIAGWTA